MTSFKRCCHTKGPGAARSTASIYPAADHPPLVLTTAQPAGGSSQALVRFDSNTQRHNNCVQKQKTTFTSTDAVRNGPRKQRDYVLPADRLFQGHLSTTNSMPGRMQDKSQEDLPG